MKRPLDPMSVERTKTPSVSYVLRRRYGSARYVITVASWVTAINLLLQPVAVWAGTYYWDSDSTTSGFGTTTGTWGSSAFWSTDSAGTSATANTTITTSDTVNFGTATLNYGNVAVGIAAGGVNVGSIVYGAGQTTSITLGTADNAISINSGITMNSGAAAQTISSPITLGANQIWYNYSANALTITAPITGTGSLEVRRATIIRLTNTSNTYQGATDVASSTLEVAVLANGGVASSIGQSSNAAGNLVLRDNDGGRGVLRYIGTSDSSTDRLFTALGNLGLGKYAGLDVAAGAGKLSFTNTGAIVGNARIANFTFGASNAGVNTFAPLIPDGVLGTIYKTGSGEWDFTNSNTYLGATYISGGTLGAAVLANGGAASSIGQSPNAATSLVFEAPTATLKYIGSANATTDRGFTMSSGAGGGATLDASGTGSITFDNTVAIAYGTANQTRVLTLTGTSTAANEFGKVLADNGSGVTSLVKNGTGLWKLTATNTYTGNTTVNAGTLRVNGQLSSSTSAVTIASGGTLDGTGTILRPVTVQSGGMIGAATSTSTLAIGANLTLSPGGMVNVPADATPSAGLVNVTGNFTYTSSPATYTLKLSGTPNTGTTYKFLQWSGSGPSAGNVTADWLIDGNAAGLSTPNTNWTLPGTGNWDIAGNWDGTAASGTIQVNAGQWLEVTGLGTGASAPVAIQNVFIRPSGDSPVVTGPASGSSYRTVKTLTIGADSGSQIAELALQTGGNLTVTGLTTITTLGKLSVKENMTTGGLSITGGNGTTGLVVIDSGKTLTLTGGGAVAVSSGGTLTSGGTIAGTPNLTTAGTINLNASSSTTLGTVDITAGSVTVNSGATTFSATTVNLSGGNFSMGMGSVTTANLGGTGTLAGSSAVNQVNVAGGTPTFSGNAVTLTVTGGTTTIGSGAKAVTVDLSVGTGTVNAVNPLAITSTLKLSGGVTCTYTSGGGATSFTASNPANGSIVTDTARTFTLSGGTLALAVSVLPSLPTVAGLRLRLEADSGITQSGGLVSQWNDQSSNGYNATQATAANQPTYVTGASANGLYGAVRFDGSRTANGDYLSNSAAGMPNSAMTMFVVYTPEVNTGGAGAEAVPFYWGQGGGGRLRSLYLNGTSSPLNAGFAGYGADKGVNKFTVNAGTQYLSSFQMQDLTTLQEYNRKTGDSSSTLAYSGTSMGFGNIGVNGYVVGGTPLPTLYNYPYKGDISAILVYDGSLTATDLQAVDNYLYAKYFGPPTSGTINFPNTAIAATATSTLDLAAVTENHTLGNVTVTAGAGANTTLTVNNVNTLTIGTLTVGINGAYYGKLDLGTKGLTLGNGSVTKLAVTSVSPTVTGAICVAVAAAGSFTALNGTQVIDNTGKKWNVQVRAADGVTVDANGPQLWLVATLGGTVIMIK